MSQSAKVILVILLALCWTALSFMKSDNSSVVPPACLMTCVGQTQKGNIFTGYNIKTLKNYPKVNCKVDLC